MKFNNTLLKSILTLAVIVGVTGVSYASIATDAKLQYNKGIDYFQLGQLDQAASCFKNAIELDPNYIDAYYNLGSILEYLNQDEAALAVFKQIILRKPDDYESVYKAAQLSKKVGEFDKAKMYLTLIPTDTLIGQRAKQLADSMGGDVQTPQPEQAAQEPAQEPEPVQKQAQGVEQVSKQAQAQAQTQQPAQVQEQPQAQPQKVLTYQDINPQNNSNGLYSDISSPTGVATDDSGNLYVAGFSDNTIYKIGPDNKKIVYIKSEKIDGPIGIAIDTPGNIYIANYNKNNVLKVDRNGAITELIENVQNPYCMHITGDLLFISSQGSNSIIRYKLTK